MVNYMSSSELYCQACSNMFPDTHAQWQGHWSIIQVLSRKGIYISDETSVTETVLVQTAPFRLKAHLALIDALMRAYIAEVASVEKVVKAVKRVTTFPASSELPSAPEEALKFWINKICTVLGSAGVDMVANGESAVESGHKVSSRLVKPVPTREPVQVPLLEDLMRDIGDGTSVAAVIAYYRPNLVNIKDLCLKDSIGIADSLYNLRQIGEFCRNHLPWKCFMVTYEDLLYTHEVMKVNILTFLADLFYYFEGLGGQVSETSSALIAAKEKIDAMPAAGRRTPLSGVANVPISSVTKKSFQRLPFEDTASNLGMNRTSAISPSSHQPLLPRRSGGRRSFTQEDGQTSSSPPTNRKGRRTLSLSSPQERETVHKSVLAWQDDQKIHSRSDDKRQSGEHQQGRGSLLANVSIDSTLNQSTNAENLSLDLSELDTPRLSKGSASDPNHPDYMELESVTSGRPSRFASPQEPTDRLTNRTPTNRLEPLTPAVLRPTKERDTNLSKAEERGDRLQRKKQVHSPSHPFPPSQRSTQQPSGRSSSEDLAVSLSSSSSETTVSSLPSGESPTPHLIGQVPLHRPFEAFTVGTGISQQYEESPPNSVRSNAISTAGSYTVANSVSSQAARAAGIPIVSDSNDMTSLVDTSAGDRSREGSVASSGEYSDHESQKIHQDHKLRESGTPMTVRGNNNNGMKPAMIIADGLGSGTNSGTGEGGSVFIKLPPSSNTTNFAELKRLKDKLGYKIDKVDNSALIYMQSCSQGGPYDKMAAGDLKTTLGGSSQGQGHLVPDKTNQAGLTSPSPVPEVAVPQTNGAEPASSDLQQLRLKLEQKRREIERKKHRQEAQQTKMRQRLGKAAFMRVVSKHLEGGEEEEAAEYEETSRQDALAATSTQAQIQARLGHPMQRLPLGHTARSQPVSGNAMPQGTLGPLIPPDTSAQRFTDWTSVSKSNQTLTPRPGNLDEQQSPGVVDPGTDSQKSGNKAFSREGIQQTIDNVKNKWFNSNSDLVTGGGFSEEDAGSYRVSGNELVGGASARTDSRESSQSPHMGRPSYANSPVPGQNASPQVRDTSSPRPIKVEPEYQEYDSSLDKLNNSLTELQGEIMRLSLQHEQLKAAQSPVSGQPVGFDPRLGEALQAIGSPSMGASPAAPRPIQGIPQQAPYVHGSMVRSQQQSGMSNSFSADVSASPLMNTSQQQQPLTIGSGAMTDSNSSGLSRSGHEARPGLVLSDEAHDQSEMDSSSEGFFIAYAEDTPKRPKPKLSDQRGRGVSPSPQSRQTPVIPLVSGQDDQAGASKGSGLVTLEPQLGLADDGSPSIGFVIKDQEALSKEQEYEDEMQKKKIKLMEMQRKRKEEQEKRRLEKEAEMAKKAEEKMYKEEEQERKKAEDKARREVIFQQYLQKKQEDEEVTPTKVKVKKRDSSSGGKPRPKSMFVKSKAMTPEPGALGGMDSGSSSQEDLIGRDASGGRTTPGVMSAMRSTYHFRLPQPTRIRKAVSCNTLQQGASNGAQGPSTYRRPPSPDLYRIKQQRQRGNSQDSGSETGSGSNPGSDYAGPKLFVKPSAKSNRHIIVNAISHCCLAGSVNTDMKNKVLEELSKCEANHFLILFRDAGCQYKGLFIFYPETEEAFKVHGVGPKHITNKMCEKFYKYNSGAKSFMEITSTKHLSVSVDAVVLQGTVWKTGKVVVKR
ncbi:unnamed protein product [Lymnaea stagnalis]|uniref:Uncharacterized protein n=1 Tax=Lymnaea stagnalis TaxID=6523 RepID=A0AAV2IBF1_LYMST